MYLRSMMCVVTALALLMADYDSHANVLPAPSSSVPNSTACPATADQPADGQTVECQTRGTPTGRAPTAANSLTDPASAATQLIELRTWTAYLPVVQGSNGGTPDPGVNQLVNPCFDGKHNDDPPGWQQTPGWDVSMYKNPCGPNGTAGRINDPAQAGESAPLQHEYIGQVVPGLGPRLVAEERCVYHGGGVAEMNIFGGNSASGPWTLVWTPFTTADCSLNNWGNVLQSQRQLGKAWAFYKVQFHAMYETVEGGVKFTSVYFASDW